MKRYILTIAVLAGILVSCQKLDIKPTNVAGEEVVFGGEAGMDVYMANIYRKLPIEDFRYRPGGEDRAGMNLHHEWQNFFHAGATVGEMVGPFGGMDIGGGFGYWPYDDIRAVNYVIENIPKYAGNFTGARANELLGEAYFCRAFFYFALAKRYGGVPIISTVQNYPQQSIEELKVHRNKEEELWTFIGEDLDKAYEMMAGSSPRGRANKYAALALKTRAMLYAGSIAKYGSTNFVDGEARTAGFVGIPADKANTFFQKAWDAAKLLEGKGYALYNKYPNDRVKNYTDAFLDPASEENILVRDYSMTTRTAHSWDATFSPGFMTVGPESRAYPTLEFVERWGKLPVLDGTDHAIKFNNLADLMNNSNLEPRLLATVYFPGATLRGKTFDTQRGLYENMFTGTVTQEVAKPLESRASITTSDPNTLHNGRRIIGEAGMKRPGAPDNATRTGFFVRKYIDYNKAQSVTGLFQSEQAWIEFRYAEILLNRAEAAVELNKPDDALTCINLLRERAGGAQLSLANVTIEEVRNERCKELAFENHYYWDLKRWRIADVLLNNAKFKGLMPYYVISENKYIFLAERETFDRNYNFEKKFYYEPIPGGELGKNPNLYPNNPNY